MIGRPNLVVRNPVPSKKEWDAVQALHPKALLCSVPLLCGTTLKAISAADTEAFAELMGDVCFAGSAGDPLYLHVQKFHRAKLTAHLEHSRDVQVPDHEAAP
jgi:hypothetical protein